jgi:hypothetical protein
MKDLILKTPMNGIVVGAEKVLEFDKHITL